jgi:hypothetical protein
MPVTQSGEINDRKLDNDREWTVPGVSRETPVGLTGVVVSRTLQFSLTRTLNLTGVGEGRRARAPVMPIC